MRSLIMVLLLCVSAMGQTLVSPPGELITDPTQFMVPNINTFPTFGGGQWPTFQRPPQPFFNFPVMQWDVPNDTLRFQLYWDVAKMSAIGIPSTNFNPFVPDPTLFHPNHGVSHFFLMVDFGNMFPATVPTYFGGFPIGPFMGQPNPIAELRIDGTQPGPFCPMAWSTTIGFPTCTGGLWGDVWHTLNISGYPPGFVQWASTIDMAFQFAVCIPNGLGEWAFLLTWPQVI